jgi:hypothetical protein
MKIFKKKSFINFGVLILFSKIFLQLLSDFTTYYLELPGKINLLFENFKKLKYCGLNKPILFLREAEISQNILRE